MDQNNPPTPAVPPRSVMNMQRSLERMGGDRTLLHDLASFFLEDSEQLLSSLTMALENKDTKQAARNAHSLSGLSANFTAESCSAIGKAVEHACEQNDLETARSLMATLRKEIETLIGALHVEILGNQTQHS